MYCDFVILLFEMNRLTIDEGNSSVKMALWRDNVMVAVSTQHELSADVLRDFVGDKLPVDSAIFCSVCRRDPAQTAALLDGVADRTIVLGPDTKLPLAVDYRTPATLGPDRVAAAVGAWVLAPDTTMLVVDMGTAITYDVVTADRRYIGGNIAPGIFLRLEALHHFTKALPMVETDGEVPRWGHDTATAMRSGAIRGVVGELQYYRHSLGKEGPARVILTGGSAELILPLISQSVAYEPNLVMIGLHKILIYNEE